MSKEVFNYKKINKRINELEAKRNERGTFTGTDDELDELMNLDTYNRQSLPHALCLDFKTNVTYVENWFTYNKGCHIKTTTTFLVVDGRPYTFHLEHIESEKDKAFNYRCIGVLKPFYNDQKERRFFVDFKDISCCDCYFIKDEIKEVA